ncbi:MAG: hypothetical protein AB7I59_15340 [Geminicoccaceae bacterium]
MRKLIAAAVLTLVGASGAQAQAILSAGALYGGGTQFRAVCYFYNSGGTTLQLSGAQIATPSGSGLALVANECGATLGPGRSCGIAANVANNLAYNCRVTVSPGKGNARGVFEMRNSSGTPLINVELR